MTTSNGPGSGWDKEQHGQGQPGYGQGGYDQGGYGQGGSGQGGYGAPMAAPDNHLVWAILSTVFCCLPLGVVSIVKATQVSSLWAQGQHDAARASADQAKKFAIYAACTTVGFLVLYVIGIAAGFASFELDTDTSS
ncbi:CD225/dispanin family protein [Rhodococcus sp. X156]|uniref:CD225/dispanin family protein n=1 Tax=Rhodococcus sp. X156 TaxID=2499145 RepID=UPI000FD96A07|nr:CD225/dispanin family protein [Rhodococcus sp. X156]